MIPGVNGGELIVIAVVALVVVGPKDLPNMLRKLGQFMGKMRRMANGFREAFDDMGRQSELDDLRKEINTLKVSANAEIQSLSKPVMATAEDIENQTPASNALEPIGTVKKEPESASITVADSSPAFCEDVSKGARPTKKSVGRPRNNDLGGANLKRKV